jgi:uncharacterized protein (TIGR02217 family)
MATFSEALFPLEVSAWAIGGRGFKTTVVQTYGGDEYRNAAWSQALGEWDVTEALRNTNPNATYAVKALRAFIMAGMGMLYPFRFRDPQDHTDEGGGVLTLISGSNYQLKKRYSITSFTYDQTVTKPVNPIVVTGGTVNSVDYTTGIVTMTSGTPTSWTGSFDIPARFAEDYPHIGLEPSTGAMFAWQQIKLIEVRNY